MGTWCFTSLVLVASFFFQPSEAWWDHGHQLVAAIAHMNLTEVEFGRINNALAYWKGDYPHLSNLVDAATWPDHTKCSRVTPPYCTEMPFMDALEVFSDWHFHDSNYNPQNLALAIEDAAVPYPHTGAIWALEQLIGENGSKFAQFVALKNVSAVSLNLRLRFLIHIFGDIHQPLHASTTFSHKFPNKGGDRGASIVNATYTGTDETLKKIFAKTNLHAVWDAVGGIYPKSWPETSNKTIWHDAMTLYKKYEDKFTEAEKSETNFTNIVKESFDLAKEKCYGFKEFHFDDPNNQNPYNMDGNDYVPIDDDFITQIQETTERRVALAGFRLKHLLKKVAKDLENVHLPPWPMIPDDDADTSSTIGRVPTFALTAFALVLGATQL